MNKRIFYHDTDAGGVVYYGRYLNYLEEARTEFIEARDVKVKDLAEQGYLFAVRECRIVYKSPARYGDIITIDAVLQKATAAQLFFTQTIRDHKDGHLMVEAEVTLVCLTKDFKPAALPEDLREKLSKC